MRLSKSINSEDGTEELIEMPDPDSGSATAKTSTFYTDADGYLKTPEKLPLGRYRVVEIEGPEGFFNDEQYNVVFELTSDRVWEVVGNATDDMDDFVITEEYSNHETLGQLTLRKIGNVLTGYEDGQFQYEQANLAGATYEIRAHGDIATGDRQGTLWYADGDLVATVTTGEAGQVDEVRFSPTRTPATYDFLIVSHDGTTGEVTITLPLGSYDITEVQAPYGFVLTDQTYTVTFGWNDQSNDVVLAQTIVITPRTATRFTVTTSSTLPMSAMSSSPASPAPSCSRTPACCPCPKRRRIWWTKSASVSSNRMPKPASRWPGLCMSSTRWTRSMM